jgi:hypothetical protein
MMSLAFSIGKAERTSLKKSCYNNVPGPGSYRAPSDFGYLELSKYKDLPTERSTNGLSPR